ncbi:MAG: glycosyltransferase family 4 protein [Bacteroidales bacterium]|nr:glycosyltransferase family 4 protein [Bacteroidales bacterium]
MKIGLVLPGNIWMSPFIKIYTQILDECDCQYDIISWNRDGTDKPNGIQFNELQIISGSRFKKVAPYLRYIKFVKHTIRNNKYDKLIIFGPQIAIPLCGFLSIKYKKKYIFDYRDFSIDQYSVLKPIFKHVLTNSAVNMVSSPGYIQCLPKRIQYIISHNFDIAAVKQAIASEVIESKNTSNPIEVLTIGSIRNFSSNSLVIKALSNKSNFKMQFVGKGLAADQLKTYAHQIGTSNIIFTGYYPKEQEPEYIKKCSFLNIFCPNILSHSTLLSNRFYLGLIYKRPMIVSANSIQGDYCEKYNLGISVTNINKLSEELESWYNTMNYTEFSKRCNKLLEEFIDDYDTFKSNVLDFLCISA